MKPALFVSLLSITIGSVQAAPILGSLWEVSNAVASNAVLANVPITPPDVTFEVNAPLQFNNGTTVNAFLNSGGAFNITALPSALSRAISPSLIQFTGQVSVTNGQQFTVAHDDGLTLIVGGTPVIDVPGPTAPTQTVLHIAALREPFLSPWSMVSAARELPYCRSIFPLSRRRPHQVFPNRQHSASRLQAWAWQPAGSVASVSAILRAD